MVTYSVLSSFDCLCRGKDLLSQEIYGHFLLQPVFDDSSTQTDKELLMHVKIHIKFDLSLYIQIRTRMDDEIYDSFGATPQQSEETVSGVSEGPSDAYSGQYSSEVRFENEYNVYERVGGFDILGELGTGNADVDLHDPVQRFTQFTKTVAQEMITQGIITLKKPDVRYIIDQIPDILNSQYKNPTAFVLGFWVTRRDGTIDKDRVKKLLPNLASLTYPVKDYDVIRYANLWINTHLYIRD